MKEIFSIPEAQESEAKFTEALEEILRLARKYVEPEDYEGFTYSIQSNLLFFLTGRE